jgi:F-type H+/Na+-transporting ATPase subunit alpha
MTTPAPAQGVQPATTLLDGVALSRLLSDFPGSRVTLAARTHLDDGVVRLVRELVCQSAGREIALDVKVSPTMDAGAVLLVGDVGRVVFDPRVMWLADAERALQVRLDAGELPQVDDAYEFLRAVLEQTAPEPAVEHLQDTGTVVRIGDGVVAVGGLRDVGSQEIVEFEDGTLGLAFSLKENVVGCVLLGSEENVREGGSVRRSGHLLRVPAGEGVLGRVLDPVCRPIDGRDAPVPSAWMPVERMAPGVVGRQPVSKPLHTGMKVIDALVPIGRGQRELIIGDRKLGKTTLAVDTILAQKGRDVACVYCAIGQKASTVRQIVATLEEYGALEYTAVVVALPSDMPALRYLAPYTAMSLGEYFMDRGGDALVVFDDLTKHAVTYREMSALLDRPVGREAYPGDVFYVHSRLLERAARLSQELGGGSLTALPIIETLAGDISAFIPTNVISICDGQIMLDAVGFNEGRRPSMDPGLSVSRVGGSAQARTMKQVAGRLRIDLAQYEEMARFVKFGAEVDEATQKQLTRGERARELLKQDQHTPMPTEHEVFVLYAVVHGYFDDVAVNRVGEVEAEMLEWATRRKSDVLQLLDNAEGLSSDAEEKLAAALDEYTEQRRARAAAGVARATEDDDELASAPTLASAPVEVA